MVPSKYDYNKRLTTLTVITLSGIHKIFCRGHLQIKPLKDVWLANISSFGKKC